MDFNHIFLFSKLMSIKYAFSEESSLHLTILIVLLEHKISYIGGQLILIALLFCIIVSIIFKTIHERFS